MLVWGIVALSLLIATPAWALGPLIFNTGTDASNAVLPDSSIDPHYVLFAGGPAITQSSLSITPAADTLSTWIRPNSNLGPGSYTYETTFTMAAPGPITITGQWAAYAVGVDMRINNVSTGAAISDPAYAAWHPFSASGNAVAGSNTLDFVVAEDFGNANTGLRVEISSVTPEPASLGFLGLIGTSLLARRRRD